MESAVAILIAILIVSCVVLTAVNLTYEPEPRLAHKVAFATSNALHRYRLGSTTHESPDAQDGITYQTGDLYLQFDTDADGIYRITGGDYPVLVNEAAELVGFYIVATGGANRGLTFVSAPEFDSAKSSYKMVVMTHTRFMAEQSSVKSLDKDGLPVYTDDERRLQNVVTKLGAITGTDNTLYANGDMIFQPADNYQLKVKDATGDYFKVGRAKLDVEVQAITLDATSGDLDLKSTTGVHVGQATPVDFKVHTTNADYDLFVDAETDRVFLPQMVYQATETAAFAADTFVAADLVGGFILQIIEASVALPTPALLKAAVPGVRVGDVIRCVIHSTPGVTITTVTGITLQTAMVIGGTSVGVLYLRFTAVDTPTIDAYLQV